MILQAFEKWRALLRVKGLFRDHGGYITLQQGLVLSWGGRRGSGSGLISCYGRGWA